MGFLKKMFGSTPQQPARPPQPPAAEPEEKDMHTLRKEVVVEPFGKINYWNLPNGGKRVRAYVLMEHSVEGTQTGVAIDGSGSMAPNFGKKSLRQARQLTQQDQQAIARAGLANVAPNDSRRLAMLIQLGVYKDIPAGANIVEDQARQMTAYLSRFDADGGTTVIYWATGDGKQIEVLGDLTHDQCPSAVFGGPTHFGSATFLTPAIRYFVERFKDARWGMYVFITDGQLHDLEEVKKYCTQLAHDVEAGKRQNLKFVLIGVGDDIDEKQMEELDDLDTGTDIDLWDHKIAKEMTQLAEIFAEVVSESFIVAPQLGIVRDAAGNIVKDYRDTGLPAQIVFELPPNSNEFCLELGENQIVQALPSN
jgi:hypothetical protein